MRMIVIAALAALTAGCLPKGNENFVVVDGEGVVKVTPEVFTLSATLQSNEATQSAALAKISATLARVTADVPRLEGLEKLEIDPSAAEIEPVYDFTCARNANYEQRNACPITGYIAKVTLTAEGAPASVAGNVLSLMTEFGALEAALRGYSVIDYDAARSEAATIAMKNARAKAERLATAAGASLGSPSRIQYGEGNEPEEPPAAFASSENAIIVTGSRITPAVNFSLTPQPFEVKETVTASFTLQSPKP